MHKPLLREHVSSRSPAGMAQQSQGKQVPVLRLFSIWKALWSELHSHPFSEEFVGKVHLQDLKLNIRNL